MTTIYLIRHGEVHNPEQILYGRMPGFRLSETGRQQAKAAGNALNGRDIVALFASPQQRAQETAALIAAANGDETIITEPRLNEVHVPYEGHLLVELAAKDWDLYTGNQPPYELPPDIQRRTQDFIAHVRRDYAGQSVAAITHGDIVLFMILFANRIHIDQAEKVNIANYGITDNYPATASISTFAYHSDDPEEIPQFSYQRPY